MGKVHVPRNVIGMKVKFLFGLTKRQVICFGSGILVGLPFFLLIKKALPANIAALLMIALMLPFFLFAMYEKNGQPLEQALRQFVQYRFVRPRIRKYQTDNVYAQIVRCAKAEKEVKRIVQGTKAKARQDAKAHRG